MGISCHATLSYLMSLLLYQAKYIFVQIINYLPHVTASSNMSSFSFVFHILLFFQNNKKLANLSLLSFPISDSHFRGGSRTAATSKMECFVIIVNGWKPLTIITKHSILDVAAVLDPPLHF